MKQITLIALLIISTFSLSAQDFEVPTNYEFKTAEDYAPYEQTIIDGTKWLMETPLNEQKAKRKEFGAFFIAWISGSPNVSIELNGELVTFMKNPDCFLIFMAGWSKYALESKDFKNKRAGAIAGLEAAIELYTKNRNSGMSKDKNMEKYVKLKAKSKLTEHVAKFY